MTQQTIDHESEAVGRDRRGVPLSECEDCDRLRRLGRVRTTDPVHCSSCHLTWTGNEAQHCVVCHRTFSSVHAADAHRRPDGTHLDPAETDGWHEKRPNVWTNRERRPAELVQR